jgi:hypothetical protein
LSWQYSPPTGFSHYNVYRRYWDNTTGWYGDWVVIGTPTQASFTDWNEVMDPNSNIYAYYRITAVNPCGESQPTNSVNTKVFGPPTRLGDLTNLIVDSTPLPEHFALSQNYPNPFNPETEISFTLPEPSTVRLSVLDVLGREVAVLEDRQLPAGHRKVRWDGRSTNGEPVSSGVYFYRLSAIGESGALFTRTMIMLMNK